MDSEVEVSGPQLIGIEVHKGVCVCSVETVEFREVPPVETTRSGRCGLTRNRELVVTVKNPISITPSLV
jgi:hypothetical protein